MTRIAPLISELKARRQTLGWSLKDVADRCGIGEKPLNCWEHGVSSPRLDEVENWAAALGVKLALAGGPHDVRPRVGIDWDERRITVDGAPVRLTPMEWNAIERLAKVPGELVTQETLFRHLYGDEQTYRVRSTAIRVLIAKLRRLLPLRIEARWGRGYVVSGIEPLLPDGVPYDHQDKAAEPGEQSTPLPGKRRCGGIALVPRPIASDTPSLIRDRADFSRPDIRRVAAAPSRPSAGRAEELGVIERFLVERGATRCPDVATIQHSPLPTLVWDKIKRKWVRPPPHGPGGELTQYVQ